MGGWVGGWEGGREGGVVGREGGWVVGNEERRKSWREGCLAMF